MIAGIGPDPSCFPRISCSRPRNFCLQVGIQVPQPWKAGWSHVVLASRAGSQQSNTVTPCRAGGVSQRLRFSQMIDP